MLSHNAANVSFVQADIASELSTKQAFDEPWLESHENLPLTVFHTAAVINSTDRFKSLLGRVSSVNTTGTANVIAAAKCAGADVFIATSSASVSIRRVQFWIWPWERFPRGYFQAYSEEDAYEPLRNHEYYFGNYAVSKAQAEKLVMAANSPNFRTGCIRPANGVYGNKYDHTVGTYLSRGATGTPT